MKRSRYLAVAIMVVGLLLTSQVLAVPAHPGRMKVRQPDGTTISIRLHGNEYQHYSTTDDGYTILRNADRPRLRRALCQRAGLPSAHQPASQAQRLHAPLSSHWQQSPPPRWRPFQL